MPHGCLRASRRSGSTLPSGRLGGRHGDRQGTPRRSGDPGRAEDPVRAGASSQAEGQAGDGGCPAEHALPLLQVGTHHYLHNGREFSDHDRVAKILDCEDYFTTPYRSCERGTNENGNGLLRQYFPKSMTLSQVTPEQVQTATNCLNNRPRKCLGYRTPKEAFLDAILDEQSVALIG